MAIHHQRKRENDTTRRAAYEQLRTEAWVRARTGATLLVLIIGCGLALVLLPSIAMWLSAEQTALEAGLTYITPISGWRSLAWIVGLLILGAMGINVIARILYGAKVKGFHPPATIETQLALDFAAGPPELAPIDRPAYELSPFEFETEVARVIAAQTGLTTRVIGGSGDGGIDIEVYRGGRLVGVVQCKRYDPKRALPPGHVRELYAAKVQRRVSTAYLVTTAAMSAGAHTEARRLGIRLITGEDFERLRRSHPPVQKRNSSPFQIPTPIFDTPPRRSLWDD